LKFSLASVSPLSISHILLHWSISPSSSSLS